MVEKSKPKKAKQAAASHVDSNAFFSAAVQHVGQNYASIA